MHFRRVYINRLSCGASFDGLAVAFRSIRCVRGSAVINSECVCLRLCWLRPGVYRRSKQAAAAAMLLFAIAELDGQ